MVIQVTKYTDDFEFKANNTLPYLPFYNIVTDSMAVPF
jgi:hypothetical protein